MHFKLVLDTFNFYAFESLLFYSTFVFFIRIINLLIMITKQYCFDIWIEDVILHAFKVGFGYLQLSPIWVASLLLNFLYITFWDNTTKRSYRVIYNKLTQLLHVHQILDIGLIPLKIIFIFWWNRSLKNDWSSLQC